MSDPMTTRDTTPPPPPPNPPDETPPEKGTSPLLWILLVVGLLALAWYLFAGRGEPDAVPAETTPAVETGTGDEASDTTPDSGRGEPAATAEPADTAAAPAARAATPIARLQPEYPRDAFRAREEGTVLLRAHVGSNGMTTSVEVIDSSDSRDLDRAATEAVSEWRFEPAMENGQAVASTVEVPITFELDDE